MGKRQSRSQKSTPAVEASRPVPVVGNKGKNDHKADTGMNETKQTQTQTAASSELRSEKSPVIEEARQRVQEMTRKIDDADHAIPQALHDTLLDERNDVMQVITELEDQLDRHQEVRESLERELTQQSDKVQTSQQRAQELEWQLVTLQTRVEALEQVRQEVTLLEDEVANANGRIQRLNEEYDRIEKERGRLKAELKAANKQLEELWAVRKERDGLRSDVKSLTTKVEELDRGQRDLIDERGQLQTRLRDAQVTLEEVRAERHQHQILLRAAEDRGRELAHVQEELADKLETVRAEKKNLQAQIARLERENARLIEQRHFYETELASLRNMNRNAEIALTSVKKAFAEVRVALTETKSRARRRMIETWPKIGVPLRGIETGDLPITPTGTESSNLRKTSNDNIAGAETASAIGSQSSIKDNGG